MALMSYPTIPAIMYKGYGGYLDKQECESMKVPIENQIANYEIQRGNTVYIETYCMEMQAFEDSVIKDKKLKGTNLGV